VTIEHQGLSNPIQSNDIWRIQALCFYVCIWTKLYTFIHTVTIYTLASNSGNVSMPIKFNFLINPESIHSIFKYVSRLCINNNVRKTIPYCNNSITKKNIYVYYNAYVLIAFYIYYL